MALQGVKQNFLELATPCKRLIGAYIIKIQTMHLGVMMGSIYEP